MRHDVTGWAYVIERELDGSRYSKIGITGNLDNRLRGYQTAAPRRDFEYAHTWELDSIEEARALEREVLAAARDAWWPQRGEWSKIPGHVLASLVEDHLEPV